MLVLLSLLAADPVTMIRLTGPRITAAQTPAEPSAPRRSPYRLDPNIAGPADGKAAALGATGERCSVTGARLCTRKPRTVFASSY